VKTILAVLLSLLISFSVTNLSWAHGGGGGGGAGGSGGGGSHGGNGSSMGVGHGSSMSLGHSNHGNTVSTRGSHSHGFSKGGTHHGKSQTTSKSLAHHSRAHRHSTSTAQLARNDTLRGKKNGFVNGLPPGLELQLDRGKSLPPGWQSKVGPGTVFTDTDTAADNALTPGQEIQADRGQVVTPETNSTD
jgi:hypothetical protein